MKVSESRMNLERVKQRIVQNNFVVMRDKWTKKPLGVAMTEDGLKYVCNKLGKALYFKNAFFRNGRLEGQLSVSNKIYVEKFNPIIDKNYEFINEEANWMHKCNKLLSLDNLKYNITN